MTLRGMAAVAVVLTCVGLLSVAGAQIAPPPASYETLPYQGWLESNAVPVNQPHDFCFQLWDADTGGNLAWSEQQHGIAVSGGAFGVRLGGWVPLPATVAHAPALYLRVGVAPGTTTTVSQPCGPADEAGFTMLAGRQQLGAVGYAVAARQALYDRDFVLPGAGRLGVGTTSPTQPLDVNGNALVRGNQETAGNSVVNGNLGVGVPAPVQKLEVAGTIAATGALTAGGRTAVVGDGSECVMKMYTSGPVDVNVALAGFTDAQCVWSNNGIYGYNGSGCYYGLDAAAEWDGRDLVNHYAIHSACGNRSALLVCCR